MNIKRIKKTPEPTITLESFLEKHDLEIEITVKGNRCRAHLPRVYALVNIVFDGIAGYGKTEDGAIKDLARVLSETAIVIIPAGEKVFEKLPKVTV